MVISEFMSRQLRHALLFIISLVVYAYPHMVSADKGNLGKEEALAEMIDLHNGVESTYDFLIAVQELTLNSHLVQGGEAVLEAVIFPEVREFTVEKFSRKTSVLQDVNTPIPPKIVTAHVNSLVKLVAGFNKSFGIKIDETEATIVSLVSNGENPTNYVDVHVGKPVNYLQERKKHYTEWEDAVDAAIEQFRTSLISKYPK